MKPKGKSYLRRMFSSSGRNQKREALPAARAGSEDHTADISYAAEAFVFDMQELLLRQLHVQEVLEHQPVPEHGTLQGKRITLKKKKTTQMALMKAHEHADGKPTCCAFPRVRRAVVRGGLRNGRLL